MSQTANARGHSRETGGAPPLEALPWRLEDVDFSLIDNSVTGHSEALLLLLVASSFIESGSRLYATNLVAHCQDDPDVSGWLEGHWEPEELQHGRALRAYVTHAWPSFDWNRAYEQFMRAYEPLCTMGKLEPCRGLEMAARCVVETGTTALYRAIHDHAREPVLRTLLRHIGNDEVGHYKHFYRYMRRYQQDDRSSRAAVFGALIRRSREIGREDTDIGLRCALAERRRDSSSMQLTFDEVRGAVRSLLRTSVPLGLAGAMWLRPLQLPVRAERHAQRIFTVVARAGMRCMA